MKVIVYTIKDLPETREFCMPDGVSTNVVTHEVERRFGDKGVWSFDIKEGETCEE